MIRGPIIQQFITPIVKVYLKKVEVQNVKSKKKMIF